MKRVQIKVKKREEKGFFILIFYLEGTQTT